MQPNWQPNLSNELVHLCPLQAADFEALYAVAADPLIWEQHPNPDRYKREVFTNYFTGAMESKGALLITDAATGAVIGCSRFYDYLPEQREVKIGYTFFSRSCWGKPYNRTVKHLMITHALQYADTIIFHVGANNIRSRKAMEKLGARFIGEEEVAYYGEASRLNVVYAITSQDWQ
ncbi:MAG: GNAT family N-acetyltransferase [Chitinophagales bacterium]|nr:GNAT family N-acetyltransferase [Chitinophagales bacterium]